MNTDSLLQLDSKNKIIFSVSREELMGALTFLSPFAGNLKRNEWEEGEEEEDNELSVLDESFFRDKVTFQFFESYLCISVLVDGVRAERTCPVKTRNNGVSFCVTFKKLLNAVSQQSSPVLYFVEDRFFGFIVFGDGTDEELFNIRAYSVRTQPHTYSNSPDSIHPETITLEYNLFVNALDEFAKYCSKDTLRPVETNIWFFIEDRACSIVATNGKILRLHKSPTNMQGCHIITVPGAFAERIYDVVRSWYPVHVEFSYDGNYFCISDHNLQYGFRETIEFPLCKDKFPELNKIIDNSSIIHHASVAWDDLTSVFRIIDTMAPLKPNVIMHFINDHVNIYYDDEIWNKRTYQFIDTTECSGDFVVKLNYRDLETLLTDIDFEIVSFNIADSGNIHLADGDEPLNDYNIMILASQKLDEKDLKLVDRADTELSKNENYINKYIKAKNNSYDSQKAEAISRMEHLGFYDAIIEDFKETGMPQVYEPPYGASYSLDEDDDSVLMESIADLRKKGILVWGVIRSMMSYNQRSITVDCMLYVSKNKKDWASEREDLFNGYPNVYTCCKEIPSLRDKGEISIYMSEGGTPLRRA